MARYLHLLLLLAFSSTFALVGGQSTFAKDDALAPLLEEAPSCANLDLVFLVDQSSSMSGNAGSPANDPTTQRLHAIQWVVDWLTDNAYDICPDSIHRIAVISYGSSARIDLNLRNIDPNDRESYLFLRRDIKAQLAADDMGQTDPAQAFELAQEVLADATPLGSGVRKRAIIYITDGIPCIEELGCTDDGNTMDVLQYARNLRSDIDEAFPFNATLLQLENCIEELRETYQVAGEVPAERINECFEEYHVEDDAYQESTYIWTILLKKQEAYGLELERIYQSISERHAGRLIRLTENRSDVPDTFLGILDLLVGVRTDRIACGDFAVNPYLQTARVGFFKNSEDIIVRLTFTDLDGKVVVIEGGSGHSSVVEDDYTSDGPTERYTFRNPVPGIWSVETDFCNDIEIYYQEVQIDTSGVVPQIRQGDVILDINAASMPQVDRAPYYDDARQNHLAIQVRSLGGAIIEQYPVELPTFSPFALRFDVKVTDSAGVETSYTMVWDAESKYFISAEPLALPHAGTYTVSAAAAVPYRVPPYTITTSEEAFLAERELFRFDAIPFAVKPVDLFTLEVISPQSGETISPVHEPWWESFGLPPWILPVKPFEVRVRLVDSLGNPLLPDTLYGADAANAVLGTISATDSEGNTTTAGPFPMSADGGEFVYEFTGLDAEGEYRFSATVENGYSEDYRPEPRSTEAVFQRVDSLWTRGSTYLAISSLLGLAALAMIVMAVRVRQNPLKGLLVFESQGERMLEIPLGRTRKNRLKVPSQTLRRYPQLDLQQLSVSSVPKPNRGKRSRSTESEFGFDTLDNEGTMASIRVEARKISDPKKKSTILLDQDTLTEYSDDSTASMVYRLDSN